MAKVKALGSYQGGELLERRRATRARSFAELRRGLPNERPGFSARLNLLCGLAGERELNGGRAEDIAALSGEWDPATVDGWLTRDRVPPLADLRDLVTFLVVRLPGTTEVDAWEAYLLYGEERFARPTTALLATTVDELLPRAAELLTEIVREYDIAPDSYDAELVLHRIAETLQALNVTPASGPLQPGLRRTIALQLFPETVTDS